MKFSDSLIADIARIIQIAILTGTDIVDHLRSIEVEDTNGNVNLTKESKDRLDKEIDQMLNVVSEMEK
jgi:hypothetical protein